jgi:acyl-coenzyme A thioesterase PaaI-like protein
MSSSVLIETGEWAGWRNWPHDTFENGVGPFYFRRDADGRVVCAFRAEKRHMNGGGFMHGGCFLTFADFCVFAIGEDAIDGHAVTVNLSGDFLGKAEVGDFMEGTGEVTRAGRRIIYVRGLISAGGRPALSFTSVVTRVGDRKER